MPAARSAALKVLAEAAIADKTYSAGLAALKRLLNRLKAIRGIGEWTAQYIASGAVREMDAFPATDAGLLRGAALLDFSGAVTSARLLERAQCWRPWRAYALQHLWAVDPALRREKRRTA